MGIRKKKRPTAQEKTLDRPQGLKNYVFASKPTMLESTKTEFDGLVVHDLSLKTKTLWG